MILWGNYTLNQLNSYLIPFPPPLQLSIGLVGFMRPLCILIGVGLLAIGLWFWIFPIDPLLQSLVSQPIAGGLIVAGAVLSAVGLFTSGNSVWQ